MAVPSAATLPDKWRSSDIRAGSLHRPRGPQRWLTLGPQRRSCKLRSALPRYPCPGAHARPAARPADAFAPFAAPVAAPLPVRTAPLASVIPGQAGVGVVFAVFEVFCRVVFALIHDDNHSPDLD